MALREPVELLAPEQLGALHFIAMGGTGMSGIAVGYHELGIPVSGCDQSDSPTLRQLAAMGIPAHVGHDPAQLDGVSTVVVSSAIRPDNPELVAARRAGLRIWHRSTALAALMLGHRTISVAGTHGKTTTSAMIATMISAAGTDPSYVIGSPLATTGRSAHIGHGDCFIVEADESDGSFWQYPTNIAVITNIEADHLDNWGDPENYAAGFARFATAGPVGQIVINADDPGARALTEQLRREPSTTARILTYGEAPDADVRLTDIRFRGMTSHARLSLDGREHALDLSVPGRHSLWNAAAAFAVGRLLGLADDALLAGAASFAGTHRRFQLLGTAERDDGTVTVVDDYAHHPTEIAATLSAGRRVAGQGRLVACFQPHLFSRTRDFANAFGQVLAQADLVVLTDVYPAREEPIPGVTGELVADAARAAGAHVRYVQDKTALPGELASLVRGGDLVMTIGAGDITRVGPALLDRLEAHPA
ncbi:UDP-N-acetylmuramate--L-alanine ligase [Propionibacterium australiense]|uniref:UDP-N-acetylmuramate--L-alanine ligase n=1 Tax=Propionibacterium australiense TaxID=119981 RepID=A0A383S422_9ACTN|nr:UDP-N-acetylmuramate--L-alanine ligase [Propionibacterium australiense]RLP11174.1 UDP-N-acetylmuramate--L-alanine ligase [Propionibacterium australiense]RLP12503.1 UDP-N-acetylmuramate--L-alanine ligase [Propionibacterium australiense]SYZ32677.1 UDP-N-acetylmuramate-L-alanine ligase [Propionibacterium australiense]VEH91573.1 UDP-N-acetylmuramate--L-alanine ligase [Propionibacterium australiense]